MDKTVENIVYWGSIFLNIVAVPVLPSPPSLESNVVGYSKESLIPGRLWEATLNWGKGFSFRKGLVLEIVLLRSKVDMMGKTFSSSFFSGIVAQWARTRPPSQFLTQSYLSRHMFNMDEHAKCENSLSEGQTGILKIFLALYTCTPGRRERHREQSSCLGNLD